MRYKVQDENGNIFETKDTVEKFKVGDVVYMDERENIYHGDLKGGVPYGNPNKILPAIVQIMDSGSVEFIEDTDLFSSFKFNGKLLKGYWVCRREDPKSEIWIFSRGKLPGEKLEIKEEIYSNPKSDSTGSPRFLDVSYSTFPIDIKFSYTTYSLVKTGNEKLRLEKKAI